MATRVCVFPMKHTDRHPKQVRRGQDGLVQNAQTFPSSPTEGLVEDFY